MKKLLLISGLIIALILPANFASSQEGTLQKRGQKTTTTTTQQGNEGNLEKRGAQKETGKTTKAKTMSSKNMMKGKVMSLAGYVSGKMADGSFKDNDQPLVLVTGQGKSSRIYFIYNSDGTFAGKKLMAFTPNKMVNVSGKTKTVNGLNVIYADNIESAE